jgi:hypothetical protein
MVPFSLRRVALLMSMLVMVLSFASSGHAQEITCNPDLAVAEAGRCPDQGEFLTFVGPAGEQLAMFCFDGQAIWGTRLIEGKDDVPEFPGVPGYVSCNEASILAILPGYSRVMNTSPTEGWTISLWYGRPEVNQCQDGRLVRVWAEGKRFEYDTASGYGPCAQP